jgi:hypothetical protein
MAESAVRMGCQRKKAPFERFLLQAIQKNLYGRRGNMAYTGGVVRFISSHRHRLAMFLSSAGDSKWQQVP